MSEKPNCHICGYPPASMPKLERKNGDHIWICPLCGNEADAEATPWKGNALDKQSSSIRRAPMTEALETK
jgi:uncharacterized Zn finger protein (UPF0148 family)